MFSSISRRSLREGSRTTSARPPLNCIQFSNPVLFNSNPIFFLLVQYGRDFGAQAVTTYSVGHHSETEIPHKYFFFNQLLARFRRFCINHHHHKHRALVLYYLRSAQHVNSSILLCQPSRYHFFLYDSSRTKSTTATSNTRMMNDVYTETYLILKRASYLQEL